VKVPPKKTLHLALFGVGDRHMGKR